MAIPDGESPEQLLAYLQQATGQNFATREDVRRFVQESMALREAAARAAERRWKSVKNLALFVSLTVAFLQYYILDTLQQIMSLRHVMVFLPVAEQRSKSS